MEAKQKAEELINEMYNNRYTSHKLNEAKDCALICVNQILKCHIWKYNSVELYKYWQEVKQHILNY